MKQCVVSVKLSQVAAPDWRMEEVQAGVYQRVAVSSSALPGAEGLMVAQGERAFERQGDAGLLLATRVSVSLLW